MADKEIDLDAEFGSIQVVRNDPTGAFVQFAWVVQRGLVSFRALGLHVYCRSKVVTEGPDFTVSAVHLAQDYGHEGRVAIRAAMTELIDVGLMMRRRQRSPSGTFRTVTMSFEWPWNMAPDFREPDPLSDDASSRV